MKYYIQNTHSGYLGNSIFFWAINGQGYTAKLNMAEQVDEGRAKQIVHSNPEKFKAWPVDYINNNPGTAMVTDSQYLDISQTVKFV